MAKLPKRSQAIRRFILENLRQHPTDILKVASERFRVSRQAISGHLKRLVDEGSLVGQGTRRTRRYSLGVLVERNFSYSLTGLAEDIVWRQNPRGQEKPRHECKDVTPDAITLHHHYDHCTLPLHPPIRD